MNLDFHHFIFEFHKLFEYRQLEYEKISQFSSSAVCLFTSRLHQKIFNSSFDKYFYYSTAPSTSISTIQQLLQQVFLLFNSSFDKYFYFNYYFFNWSSFHFPISSSFEPTDNSNPSPLPLTPSTSNSFLQNQLLLQASSIFKTNTSFGLNCSFRTNCSFAKST